MIPVSIFGVGPKWECNRCCWLLGSGITVSSTSKSGWSFWTSPEDSLNIEYWCIRWQLSLNCEWLREAKGYSTAGSFEGFSSITSKRTDAEDIWKLYLISNKALSFCVASVVNRSESLTEGDSRSDLQGRDSAENIVAAPGVENIFF